MQLKTLATLLVLPVACTLVIHGEQGANTEFARVARVAEVRLTPDLDRKPLAVLDSGTLVKVIQRDGDWISIQFWDARYGYRAGYVAASDLNLAKGQSPLPAPAPDRGSVAKSPANGDTSTNPRPELRWSIKSDSSGGESKKTGLRARPETVVVYASIGEDEMARAIERGRKANGSPQGLVLSDIEQQPEASTAGPGRAAILKGLRVELFTTLAWIRKLASDAAKADRPYTARDVTDETLEPVIRVVVCSDTPPTATSGGWRETAFIEHVVLRDPSWSLVFQPAFRERVAENANKARADRTCVQGLRAKFNLEALSELRGPSSDREFFVTVIDSQGAQASFPVKKEQLDDLR